MGASKGYLFVLLTAIVSGVSIFVNKFAVADLNPFVFTTMKNAFVAIFLISLIFILGEFNRLRTLTRKQWRLLAAIGLVGGSIPFLLFFYAIKLTSAINAGFIHKTLFIWAAIFALIFLREKIDRKFLFGALLLFAGNFLLFSTPSSFALPDALILIAALLWAAESVIAKHVLRELHGRIVAFGRMFFGSAFMLLFLAFTNQLPAVAELSMPQLQWILLTAGFLFLYVFFWYSGLRHIKVSIATAILLLAQPITALLSFTFLGEEITMQQAIGFFLIVLGVVVATGFFYFLHKSRWRALQIAREKA